MESGLKIEDIHKRLKSLETAGMKSDKILELMASDDKMDSK